MMHVYSIKLNLESSARQPELIQALKSEGAEVIQTSDGLCLKSDRDQNALNQLLRDKELGMGVTVQEMDRDAIEAASQDVKSFVSQNH